MINKPSSMVRLIVIFGLAALSVRFASLGLFPLMDTTEARYGEIARIMMETSNWITPQFDYNIPFWGKPPLHTWMSAIGFEWLGVSEFAGRLPHFLTGLIILGLVWLFGRQQGNKNTANLAAGILATTVVFCISIGAIMTDTALLLAITLTLGSFWQAWQLTDSNPDQRRNRWGYLFFVGLGIGLLAKGPIVLILTGLPIFLWCLPEWRILQLWKRLPWVSGTLLMSAIALPWYLLAEQATPGFLNYFIVGEHFQRFLVSGWQGDLYGTAHIHPKGSIWLKWLYAALPWNIVLPLVWWKAKKHRQSVSGNQDKPESPDLARTQQWRLFLWCWMLTPMIFFTLAGNIIWTYILPATPALALLVANYIREFAFAEEASPANKRCNQGNQRLAWPGALMPVAMIIITIAMNSDAKSSAKSLVEAYQDQSDSSRTGLVFWGSRPFSGQFYSKGQAVEVESVNKLIAHINKETGCLYLVARPGDQRYLRDSLTGQLELVAETSKRQLWRLSEFKETGDSETS